MDAFLDSRSVPTRDYRRNGRELPHKGLAEPVDINHPLAFGGDISIVFNGGPRVESNERYYRRRAIEERLAARRAMTEQAKAWHAKLADEFAARLTDSTTAAVFSSSAISA